jgi:class 3 adenylate cyclase/glyoxylase-like metal-dependent hydrolase (beta-lactamase superfamily II)
LTETRTFKYDEIVLVRFQIGGIMKKLDDTNAIQVAEDIWWVGFADYEAGFSNNPYLLVDGDEAVLFDPGPGHPLFRDLILQKIEQVIAPEHIRYIVVHHQDPDLCGLIPLIENTLHPDLVIMAHPRTSLFIPYYGARTGILPIGDGDSLKLKSGRSLFFYHAPYLHFAGNMMSYDSKTASLFSSDIFAIFSRDWSLYADESYKELAKDFLENYIAAREPLLYAYEKIKSLTIERILPQHGGIITQDVDAFLSLLQEANPGRLIEELRNRPSPEQMSILQATGKEWLQSWLKKGVDTNSLEDLMKTAAQEGPSTISLLIDALSKKAIQLGVTNPLTYSQVHYWNNIWSSQTTQILDSIRRRFLSRQYGLRWGTDQELQKVLKQGLQAFKVNVAIMFVDIRGFTQWSAERSPDEIVEMLNRQHEIMARAIHGSGGRVNKILGDGILAYFPENKLHSCILAAEKIHHLIAESRLLPVGIGCDFGEVIMGDIGQEARLDYTLIGSVVNFASRLCSSADKGEIGVSQRMFSLLDAQLRGEMSAHSSRIIWIKIKPTDPEIEGVILKKT